MIYSEEYIRKKLKLYFILGSSNCLRNPVEVLEEAVQGGITFFQFREKGPGCKTGKEKLMLAKQLQEICKQNEVPFIVNDDIDLALELDADGVHIGQEDENPLNVRTRIGNKILGISAHNVTEARLAIEQGADYIGVGPMYPTNTKTDTRAVQGPTVIKEIRSQHITIPVVGIGGISKGLIKPVINAGADGVAIISAISQAVDPKTEASLLLNEMQSTV
ncbi:thiamine phosphate synthase [Bacillus sp. Marseille-P3661]|uniref:thiamine phosphate synthase n=1 Tax=Bacillus sp. Marseille-P3661 TaxID=1936234 RepID=UPI000C82DBEB|nr:thiamine phosphate synthase [Bacillus sp. Marseille-P3661]